MGDGRLKALYAVQAGMNAKDIQKNRKTDKAINKNNAVGINISLGSTGWKDHAETVTEETRGSRITAGRTAAVIAKEDMTVKGSTVDAKDIHLQAGNNIHILSSENKSTTIEDYKAKSGSIGASLSKGGYGIGASYGKGKGQTEETILTHTPSDITAKDTATLSSGNDTLIRGGIIKGNKVTANAGGNLTIESEQDKKNYKETGKTSGLSISYTPGSAVSVSGGKGKTNTDSTYESVTKQTGIYAGKEGYDIQVKNNTHLKGAVIDSKAPAEKNKLTTGTLTWENIDNKASYESHGKTQTVSSDKVSSSNPLGASVAMAVPVQGSHSSITRVAIADGIIQTTEGKTEKEISRDTKNTLNKLAEIFDKKSVQEKQELIGLIAKEGFTLVGDIATRKQESLRTKAAEARTHNNEAKAESYEKEAAKWAENGINRIALHGIVGALVSKEAGTGVEKGLTGAGLNAALQGALKNISDPEVRKAASLAIGQAVAGETGSAIAEYATVFNWLSHQQQEMRDKLISEAEAEGDMDKAERIRAYYQELDEKQDDVIRKLELPESDDYSPSVEAAIIESTNIYEDTDAFREVTIGALKIAKEKGLTEYHFLDEDYVTLNASIGMGIGLSGGFIMDRTGNVYSVVGGGFTGGIGGTIATGKLAMDTSGWTAANLQQALSGGSVSFGLGIGGSVTVNVSKVAGSREIGGTTGISAGMTGTYTQFICNINDL
ncbi:hemagglutinin repeat-containing protein [Dialister invisus]|uniref:hemagglutinin repeat-containing protein n=1 Tax=Dialister invisus TaxID=218538 RepID=UPI00266F5752|nr:hemagglutinin repeat-containing protein [Dialister invisus]